MFRRAGGWGRGAAVAALFCGLALRISADPHIRTGGISGNVTVATTQRFHIGDHLTGEGGAETTTGADVSPIIISCQGGDILEANDIRVLIPGTLPLTWKADILPTVSAVVVGDPANPVNPGPPPAGITTPGNLGTTFPDAGAEKTIFIDVTGNFTPGNNFTLGNLKVLNVDSVAAATHIQMTTSVGQITPYEDVAWWMVANNPNNVAFAGGQQILTPGSPTLALAALTITESNVAPAALTPFNGGIWNDKDIRITIPSTVTGVTWNTGAISSLNAKIGASVTTEDLGRTVVIPVVNGASNDFTQGESATITGLTMNVDATAPDQTFSLTVRLGGATHYTAHFTMTNACKVEGWPKLTTSGGPAAQVFTMGAAPTTSADIVIQEASGSGAGSRKMVAGVNLDVTIPSGLNMEWATVPSAQIQAPPGTASIGAITIQPGNKILRIPVTGDFSANQTLTLQNAQFGTFAAQMTTNQFLELELNAPHAGVEAVDTRPIRIGRPSISSSNDDVFVIGGGTGTLNTITVRDDTVNPVLGIGTQVRIHISSGSNLSFTGAVPTLGGGFTGGSVSFENVNKTMVITWNAAPVANAPGTIASAAVSFPASASFGNLELLMAPLGTSVVTNTSPQNLIVGSLPNLFSDQSQQFTINDPDTTARPLTISTDAGSFQLFQNGNSLQLIIPAALNLQWKNPQPGGIFPLGGTASGKMAGTVSYPDPKTLEFPIGADWALNDTLVFTGLVFTNISAVSAPTGLQLRVRTTGPIAATDTQPKAIGAPILASAANQVFGIGDPPTTMSDIVITDHSVTPRILGGTTLRIRIPAGYGMTWDPTSTPLLTLGGGTGTLNGAPSFVDTDSVLSIPIQTSFSVDQTLTITGARFVISSVSPTSNLELEVNNSGVANVLDTRTIRIGTRPFITSVTTADINVNGSIDRVTVVFNEDMEAAGSVSISSGLGFSFGAYNISSGSLDVTKRILTLVLAETGLPDTNATPALTYISSGPGAGDLRDFDDSLGMTAAIPATVDGAAPVILSISVTDLNADGRPDQAFVTFSETITGTPVLSRWTMVDGNGSTDLLGSLTDSSLSIVGSTDDMLRFDLTGAAGTMGTPRFQYNGAAGPFLLTDAAGNVVPTTTNNGPPVANAGAGKTVPPSLVTLDGSASSDPDGQPLQFSWTYMSGPVALPQLNLTGTTSATPTFLATAAGSYTFELKVNDFLDGATSMTTVIVMNVPPVAHAGPDLTGAPGFGNAPGNALLSSDANGDTLSYLWTIAEAPDPSAVGDQTIFPAFPGNWTVPGRYRFDLVVTDSGGLTSTDSFYLRVNNAGLNLHVPTADAGPDQIVAVNTQVTLDGRNSSDTDGGVLTYSWAGPATLDITTPDRPTFTPTGPGLYTFTLTVTDPQSHVSIPDTVTVLAFNPANRPPLAAANKLTLGTPAVGQKVTLDSGGSLDPEGVELQYVWTQLRGARVALSDSSGPSPTFAATQPGSYEFQLTVSDGVQYSLPAFVSFVITSAGGASGLALTPTLTAPAPVAPDGHVVNAPTLMQLGSTAAGAFIHTVWTQEAGPSVAFAPSPAATSFTPGAGKRGVYRFTRTGWDADGIVVVSPLVIVMDDPADTAPEADAGTDQTGTTGQTVTLNGSGSDLPLPAVLTPYWTQIAGPPVALAGADTFAPSFTPATPGTYLFALKVSDGVGDSTTDFVQIVIDAAAVAGPSGGSNGGCGSVGVDVLMLAGLAAVGWRRRRR